MHWARIIRHSDNAEWTAVLHDDGTVSEVKVAVENNGVHITVDAAKGKKVLVSSPTDSYELYGGLAPCPPTAPKHSTP